MAPKDELNADTGEPSVYILLAEVDKMAPSDELNAETGELPVYVSTY
jgi:hypothetical protein